MISLQLPLYLPNSLYKVDRNLSSFKLRRTLGKPNIEFSSIIPKYRLGAISVSGGIDVEKSEIPLRQELMPKHVAVILDGNGRWAKSRGLPIEVGHTAGSANLSNLITLSTHLQIKILSVYAFSTENWNRSEMMRPSKDKRLRVLSSNALHIFLANSILTRMEVNSLMAVLEDFIKSYAKDLIKRYNVRFSIIGDKPRLPKSLQHAIFLLEEASKDNKGMHVVIALSYSGQYDIVQATKKIASKVEDGILRAKEIDKSVFEQQLSTNIIEYPNPDLLIRTSGEMRASNFMLWQLAYTELYFCDEVFPDFGKEQLIKALVSYQSRHRRYGDREVSLS